MVAASTPCLVCPVAWPIHNIESTELGTAFRRVEAMGQEAADRRPILAETELRPSQVRKTAKIRRLFDGVRDFGDS
jgi:hypothetical protein